MDVHNMANQRFNMLRVPGRNHHGIVMRQPPSSQPQRRWQRSGSTSTVGHPQQRVENSSGENDTRPGTGDGTTTTTTTINRGAAGGEEYYEGGNTAGIHETSTTTMRNHHPPSTKTSMSSSPSARRPLIQVRVPPRQPPRTWAACDTPPMAPSPSPLTTDAQPIRSFRWLTLYLPCIILGVCAMYVLSELVMKHLALRTVQRQLGR